MAILLFRKSHCDPPSLKFHNRMTLIESTFLWSVLFPSNKNVCNAWKNSHQNLTKGWNICNIKCFTIPYLGSWSNGPYFDDDNDFETFLGFFFSCLGTHVWSQNGALLSNLVCFDSWKRGNLIFKNVFLVCKLIHMSKNRKVSIFSKYLCVV